MRVVHDGTERGDPMEHCCFCRARTRYWYAKNDVAVCQACAKTHPASDVPSKEDWLAKERAFDQRDPPRWGSALPSQHETQGDK